MSGKPEFEIGLITDEELMEIHHGVIDNSPTNLGAIARSFLADVLPQSLKHIFVPENKDPLTALPMFGRLLATALVENSKDRVYQESERLARETIAYSFASQIVQIAKQDLGMTPAKQRPPTISSPISDKLKTQGKILASTFASPYFTPKLGRQTLNIMAPKIDELVHPGRNELREAMKAVIRKFESVK